jgi:adenomatosis polyposis coli protein
LFLQVTASVIRNLSWRADVNMKEVLNEIGTVRVLTLAAMKCTQENTLKAILSALWNLSNHCAKNKAEFCEISGAIEFLVDMLSYDAASKTTSVIENAGGILRNISTHIAMQENFRIVLRRKSCLVILLQQLKSPSLTVVSNACGTLGNLSAHSLEDQRFLRENGAIPMLRSLIYSKHKMISTGSTIALRHLLACKSNVTQSDDNLDSVAKMMDLKELPTLNVRKQKALEHELSFSQHNDNIASSPDKDDDKSRHNNNDTMKVQDIEDEEDDDDDEEEAPTNFSKFDDDAQEEGERAEYQETNLDQITDYSIRYAENQICDSEDTMKSYNTEGTPHAVLSGAASMSDLRKEKLRESMVKVDDAKGIQTPEKTVNYCLEGTPGNFSRNDSLSDLEENSNNNNKPGCSSSKIPTSSSKMIPPPLMIRKDSSGEKESIAATPKSVTFLSLAEETPLMFSRTSSMGSLSSAEPGCVDDKSSVFSDFSRLASGIISPSELPDSPTQSIPQSPSRLNSHPRAAAVAAHSKLASSSTSSSRPPQLVLSTAAITREVIDGADDSLNAFHIENTPAAFSYAASSLSNLSFDDEPKISTDAISKDFQLMKHPSCEEEEKISPNQEDLPPDTAEQSDVESADDDILLESCINIGMNRVVKPTSSSGLH